MVLCGHTNVGHIRVRQLIQRHAINIWVYSLHQKDDCVALGECGRLPLCIDHHIKCIKYWCKLLCMPENRYPRNCYLMLKQHDSIGRKNWASAITIRYDTIRLFRSTRPPAQNTHNLIVIIYIYIV